MPLVELLLFEAEVGTVSVGFTKPKPPGGVAMSVGTANCRMLPLAGPVDCVTNT